jgi:hypothetical protein
MANERKNVIRKIASLLTYAGTFAALAWAFGGAGGAVSEVIWVFSIGTLWMAVFTAAAFCWRLFFPKSTWPARLTARIQRIVWSLGIYSPERDRARPPLNAAGRMRE